MTSTPARYTDRVNQSNDRRAGAAAPPGPAAPAAGVMADVAAAVRRLRHGRGLSADQLAARAGVSKGALVALEHASANPNLATLVRLADGLGVSVSALVERPEARRAQVTDSADAEP